MSWQIHISRMAQQDIEEALAWTLEHFGERKYEEYRDLIKLALNELATDPRHSQTRRRSEIHPSARTLHLSRRGKRARHFLLFRVVDEQTVEVGRLLYDAMDISRHLPPEYRPKDSDKP